jgi:hypothetical protein
MPDLSVTFAHAASGKMADVTLDDQLTAHEAIAQLLDIGFLPTLSTGYELHVKRGFRLSADDTFAKARLQAGTMITVLPLYESS